MIAKHHTQAVKHIEAEILSITDSIREYEPVCDTNRQAYGDLNTLKEELESILEMTRAIDKWNSSEKSLSELDGLTIPVTFSIENYTPKIIIN